MEHVLCSPTAQQLEACRIQQLRLSGPEKKGLCTANIGVCFERPNCSCQGLRIDSRVSVEGPDIVVRTVARECLPHSQICATSEAAVQTRTDDSKFTCIAELGRVLDPCPVVVNDAPRPAAAVGPCART